MPEAERRAILEFRRWSGPQRVRDAMRSPAAVSVIRSAVAKQQRVLLVGSVDLSHYGTEFTNCPSVESYGRKNITSQDETYLDALVKLRPQAAERIIGNNPTGIDAVAPMGVRLRIALKSGLVTGGTLLKYLQSYRRRGAKDCLVSHATAYWV